MAVRCEYCSKVEMKNIKELGKFIAWIVFTEDTLKDWRKEQVENPSIILFYRGKEAGIYPLCSEILSGDVSVRIYWSY